MDSKILVILFVIGVLYLICKRSRNKSPSSYFGAMSEEISTDDSKADAITDDTVLIFYADWCGHCKKSMKDFKDAVSQGNGKIVLINSDEEPDLVKKYGIKGYPTIMKAGGKKHTGTRSAEDIISFAKE
jgi:thiol-disulfide isomerase/thioredoxin